MERLGTWRRFPGREGKNRAPPAKERVQTRRRSSASPGMSARPPKKSAKTHPPAKKTHSRAGERGSKKKERGKYDDKAGIYHPQGESRAPTANPTLEQAQIVLSFVGSHAWSLLGKVLITP